MCPADSGETGPPHLAEGGYVGLSRGVDCGGVLPAHSAEGGEVPRHPGKGGEAGPDSSIDPVRERAPACPRRDSAHLAEAVFVAGQGGV